MENKCIVTRLADQYFSDMANISNIFKVLNYSKVTVAFDTYFALKEKNHWCPLLRFRLSNHNVPIEICPLYNNDIGDGFLYMHVFICALFH